MDKKQFFDSIKDLPIEQKIERLKEFEKLIEKEKLDDLKQAEQLIKESEIELLREEEVKKSEDDLAKLVRKTVEEESLTARVLREESEAKTFQQVEYRIITAETPIQYIAANIYEMANTPLSREDHQRLENIYTKLLQKRQAAEAKNLTEYVASELNPVQEAAAKLLRSFYQV